MSKEDLARIAILFNEKDTQKLLDVCATFQESPYNLVNIAVDVLYNGYVKGVNNREQ